jgi:hypothetical protein
MADTGQVTERRQVRVSRAPLPPFPRLLTERARSAVPHKGGIAVSQSSREPSGGRGPFLSLDKAAGEGPGKVLDLGTVLPWHSMVAWMDGYAGRQIISVVMSLHASHDGIHWVQLAYEALAPNQVLRCPSAENSVAWPARYVRASISQWPRDATAERVSATVASA